MEWRADQAYRAFKAEAEKHHPPEEAERIARYLLEDLYGITNPAKKEGVANGQTAPEEVLRQLAENRPLQYISGIAHFYGHTFEVDERVLIPRPETEELVYEALNHPALPADAPLTILDIGTGSGCIPISLKKARPRWEVWACDLSPGALQVARANSRRLEAEVRFVQHDILSPTPWENCPQWDAIISNPPYIPPEERSEMPRHVLDWEPEMALFSKDPQAFYKAIFRFAKQSLKAGGYLLLELNEYRAKNTLALAQPIMAKARLLSDMEGKERMLLAQMGTEGGNGE